MFRVAIVGHSQIPHNVGDHIEGAVVDFYRKPGGKVAEWSNTPELNSVLDHSYNLVFLWLGSNDIKGSIDIGVLTTAILNIAAQIQRCCGAFVWIVEPERRTSVSRAPGLTELEYKRIVRGIKRRLSRQNSFQLMWMTQGKFPLGFDGVHASAEGKTQLRSRLRAIISNERDKFRHYGPVAYHARYIPSKPYVEKPVSWRLN